MSKLNVLQGWN